MTGSPDRRDRGALDYKLARELEAQHPGTTAVRDEVGLLSVGVIAAIDPCIRLKRRIDTDIKWQSQDRAPDILTNVYEGTDAGRVTEPIARYVARLSAASYALELTQGGGVDQEELLAQLRSGFTLFDSYLSLPAGAQDYVSPGRCYDKLRGPDDYVQIVGATAAATLLGASTATPPEVYQFLSSNVPLLTAQ